jgi:beta-lactamase class A
VLLAGATAAALAASGYRGVATADPVPPIEAGLAALEDQYNAKVGFYGRNLGSGRMLGYRDNDLFATCSAFKAYVAAQILQKDQRGELRLTDEVYIDPALFVPVASPITEPNVGDWMSLSDLCAAAVRQSDNTATNLMLEILGGPASVTQFARSVGDDRTWMVRWETDLNTAYPGDPRDTSSPRGMGTSSTNRTAINYGSGCSPSSPETIASGQGCPLAGPSPIRPGPVTTPAPTTSVWPSAPATNVCCCRS